MLNEFDQYLDKLYLGKRARKDPGTGIVLSKINAKLPLKKIDNENLLSLTVDMLMTSSLLSKARK
jgi:hypothetical protein